MFNIYTFILDQLLCAFDTQFQMRRCGETEFIVSAYVNTLLKDNSNKKVSLNFFLNSQPDALIIQIYSVI